jgi:hypothetical protein
MSKAIAQTYQIAVDYRTHITTFIVGLCLVMASLYIVNIFRTVSGTISLESLNKNISSLSSEVGKLESDYINASKLATPDSLSKYGLSQGKVSVFISTPAKVGRVSMTGYEI